MAERPRWSRWPLSTLALALAVLLVQVRLWLGDDNMPQVLRLTQQLATQRGTNQAAQQRNERAAAELADLKEGLEMVEDKARAELGLVKPNEILVLYARATPASRP